MQASAPFPKNRKPLAMRPQGSTRNVMASQTGIVAKNKKRKLNACVIIEWALQRGGRSAHPFSWLLSSPQQPLETEDPPTVSLAPQYTSQHLCRAIEIFSRSKSQEKSRFLARFRQVSALVGATLS